MNWTVLSWAGAIVLLGGATGLRTMTPMAAVCWFCYARMLPVEHSWAFWVGQLVTAIVFTVLAAGEWVGDKLPTTPNRTDAFPLVARLGFGGLVGAIVATGLRGGVVEGALLGSVAALAGAFLGFHLRRYLVKDRHYPDLRVALVEDAVAVGLAVAAMGMAAR